MTTLKTILHAYCFDVSKPVEKAEYAKLKAKLAAQGMPRRMHALSMKAEGFYRMAEGLDGCTLELETKHLFDNQWNTAPLPGAKNNGLRVFDWASDAGLMNEHIRQGHYLEQTVEMREVRRNTLKCGYCGSYRPAAAGDVFCSECLGNEYLAEKDLFLLRMEPVDTRFSQERKPLTPGELEHLLPLYRDAQIHGNTVRTIAQAKKRRADVIDKACKTIEAAVAEREGMLWLMDQGINTANVIYYSHVGRFSFGWQRGVDASVESRLLEVISEFRWPYEIVCADGRKLSGNIG